MMKTKLPEELSHPLKGRPETLLAGMKVIDGTPMLSTRALANCLGVSHRRVLRLIKKHRAELEKLGPIISDEL